MVDLDALIEETVIRAEIGAGTAPHWLAHSGDARMVAVMARCGSPGDRRSAWSVDEDRFVRDNVLYLSDEEMGRALGRSTESVHIRRERHLRLPARTQLDEWPTMRRAARMLGIPCAKSVRKLIDAGLLPGYVLPLGRRFTVIPRQAIQRFACNPHNWCYFDPGRVADLKLRKLIAIRRDRWHDAWWTPGQVAAYHGVTISAVNQAIHRGRLPAVRWMNWCILRSDAQRVRFTVGKGSNELWTPAQDRYAVLARAVGLSYSTIERMAKLTFVAARLSTLARRGGLAPIAREQGVQCDGDRLYIDYRRLPGQFPMIEGAMQRLTAGEPLREYDAGNLAGVFAAWLRWNAGTDDQRDWARRLAISPRRTSVGLRSIYCQLLAMGFQAD